MAGYRDAIRMLLDRFVRAQREECADTIFREACLKNHELKNAFANVCSI